LHLPLRGEQNAWNGQLPQQGPDHRAAAATVTFSLFAAALALTSADGCAGKPRRPKGAAWVGDIAQASKMATMRKAMATGPTGRPPA